MSHASQEKFIQVLEEQLAFTKEQNKQLLNQIEALTEQVRQLNKMIYGPRTEKSKYQAPDGQCSLFDDNPAFNEAEHTDSQSTKTVTYTVIRSKKKKKRNDAFMEGVAVEEIHHHPSSLTCACCQSELHEIGTTIAREEAKIIPAKIVRVQHIEHAYECKQCKKDTNQDAYIVKGKVPVAVIPRSLASPELLAKIVHDKFSLYLPLYRQVKELARMGLMTNDKNLSNWVIRVAEDWLLPVYEEMKNVLSTKSMLHIDETIAQVLNRSDGKSGQSDAYNWVFRTIPTEGPIIVLFHHALSRSREVLKAYLAGFGALLFVMAILRMTSFRI